MTTFIVNSRRMVDLVSNKVWLKGDEIELSDEVAIAKHLERGSIIKKKEPKVPAKSTTSKKE